MGIVSCKQSFGLLRTVGRTLTLSLSILWPLTRDEFKALTSGFHLAAPTQSSGTKQRSSADVPPENKYIFFFFLHCRAHHYSSDGREVGKKTTTSRHRGESTQNKSKHKTQTQHTKPNNTKPKDSPKKREARVKRCETCGIATLKLSNVLLQEVVPTTFRCSRQRCSVPIQLPCIYHTSRSISEKVASSGSGLVSSI